MYFKMKMRHKYLYRILKRVHNKFLKITLSVECYLKMIYEYSLVNDLIVGFNYLIVTF